MEARVQCLEANSVENARDLAKRTFATIADYIKVRSDGSIVFDFLAPNWDRTAAEAAKPTFVANTPVRKSFLLRLLGKHLRLFGATPSIEPESAQLRDASDVHFALRGFWAACNELVRIGPLPKAVDRTIDQALAILDGFGAESTGESGPVVESKTRETGTKAAEAPRELSGVHISID